MFERVRRNRVLYARTAAAVAASTFLLTASFVGAVGYASGQATGFGDRLPYYVLVTSLVFVATIVSFEGEGRDGRTVLSATLGVAVLTFTLVTLGTEGVAYALAEPEQVLSDLLIYFAAASLICTGLASWGFRHRRELVGTDQSI